MYQLWIKNRSNPLQKFYCLQGDLDIIGGAPALTEAEIIKVL